MKDCPKCSNFLIGNGQGTLERTCKCNCGSEHTPKQEIENVGVGDVMREGWGVVLSFDGRVIKLVMSIFMTLSIVVVILGTLFFKNGLIQSLHNDVKTVASRGSSGG